MKNFFKSRVKSHQSKMMKYMKYVFNDHFVLVCFFLLGGLGYYYSDLVKTLDQNFIWGKPIVLVFWFILIFVGRLATLSQEADMVFLLPKEKQMVGYLKSSWAYSMLLPIFICFISTGVMMPLLVAVDHQPAQSFFWYLALLLTLKGIQLLLQVGQLTQRSKQIIIMEQVIGSVGSLIFLILSLWIQPWVGFVLATIFFLFLYIRTFHLFTMYSIDWVKMVQLEKNRMYRIYQFIHLFTDVPEVSSSVKRRKYFDGILIKIAPTYQNTYLYLYSRSFLRGTEYSGLYLRLLLVAGVILFFLPEFFMALLVSLLFIYLIGFQLTPIYAQYDYMMMTRLYPVKQAQKSKAVSQLISAALGVAGIIFGVMVFFALSSITEVLLVCISLLIEISIFIKIYLPYRLKKIHS